MKRVLTALVLIPAVVALIFAAPLVLVWAALLAVALLCLREYYDIAEASGVRPLRVVGYGACCVLILARALPPGGFLAIVAALSLAVFLQPARPAREALSATAVTATAEMMRSRDRRVRISSLAMTGMTTSGAVQERTRFGGASGPMCSSARTMET